MSYLCKKKKNLNDFSVNIKTCEISKKNLVNLLTLKNKLLANIHVVLLLLHLQAKGSVFIINMK
jgi:hypothetical protein